MDNGLPVDLPNRLVPTKIMAQIHLEHRNDYDDEKDNKRSKRQGTTTTTDGPSTCVLFLETPNCNNAIHQQSVQRTTSTRLPIPSTCQVLATRNEDCCLCNISTLLIVLLPTPRLLVLRKPTPKRKENARLRFYKSAGQQKLEQCK